MIKQDIEQYYRTKLKLIFEKPMVSTSKMKLLLFLGCFTFLCSCKHTSKDTSKNSFKQTSKNSSKNVSTEFSTLKTVNMIKSPIFISIGDKEYVVQFKNSHSYTLYELKNLMVTSKEEINMKSPQDTSYRIHPIYLPSIYLVDVIGLPLSKKVMNIAI